MDYAMPPLNRREFIGTAAAFAAGAAFSRSLACAADSAAANSIPPRKFELGLVTYNVVKDWDLATILRVCKEVGIAAVECRTTHKHGVEPSLSANERKNVKKQFDDSGIV